MKNNLKNQRGVALLIVISMLSIMTVIVVDLSAQMLINHQIATNAKQRMQAYHLAKSGLNFSKLLVYYSKTLQSEISKLGGDAAGALGGFGSTPLYKMFPISSELFRSMVAGNAAPEQESGDLADLAASAQQGNGGLMSGESLLNTESSLQNQGNFLNRQKAQEFVDFEGNFDVQLSEEYSKYSLNTISKMTATSPSYDIYKKILLEILMRPDFKTFFENQEQDAEQLVHAMADYVDLNGNINEFEQVERGSEDGVYGDVDYRVKNGKFLSVSEVRLVAGMNDDIYNKLEPFVTVYHANTGINACLNDPSLLDALIVHYTKYAGCTTPIDESDTETLADLRETVSMNCPSPSSMASALNVKLGLQSQSEVDEAAEAGTAETQATASKVGECKVQFQDLLSESNDIFKIQSTGVVGSVQRIITQIVDTSAGSPASWKTMFYQVQ